MKYQKSLRWIIISVGLPYFGTAAIHVVQPSGSIKEAIDTAQPHDTVLVKPGNYTAHSIEVGKPLTVLGEGRPHIEPGAEKTGIFIITADSVIIEGFELTNVKASYLAELSAIKVRGAKHGIIRNNIIRNCFFGIYLEYAQDYLVERNQLIGAAVDEAKAGNAIHVWKAERVEIAHNTASGHRDGIYFEFVNFSTIHDNESFENLRYGLHFMFSNNDEYLRNTFRDNGAGVAVMFSKHIQMLGNAFENNWGGASYGLLLKEISDGMIYGNRFSQNTIGILAEGANRIRIDGNQFTMNGTALDVKGNCLDNRITNNNFLANTFEVITNSQHNRNIYNCNYWSDYNGYDLDRNGIGDVPYRPVNLFSKITNEIPSATIMMHSLIIDLMDLTESIFPYLIPEELVDTHPRMFPLSL